MQERNTRELMDPKLFKFKCLIYAPPGFGKTDWAWEKSMDPGGIACETGEGNGLLTVAERELPFGVPTTYQDFQAFCGGQYFKGNTTLVCDGASEAVRTLIKDYALTLPNPRASSEQARRSAGIPVGNDYQSMAELMRRELRKLLSQPKSIIVTALERVDKPGENDPPGTPTYVGPDLPGQLLLACTAMFDFVFRLRVRSLLRDPKDAKSRYLQRYLMTEAHDIAIGKCRSQISDKPLLDMEEPIDKKTGQGYPSYLIQKITSAYAREIESKKS
jgi:hypothetical protein